MNAYAFCIFTLSCAAGSCDIGAAVDGAYFPAGKNGAAIAYAGRTCVCTSGSNTNLSRVFDRNTLGIDTVTAGTFSAADGETAAAGDGQRRVIQKNALAVAPPLESACGSITRRNAAAALQCNGYIALRINAIVMGVACRSAYDCIMQRQRAGGSVIESIPSGIGTIRTGSACAVC